MPNDDRWCRAGGGFGPLLKSLGLDELLTAVRKAMRYLNVDSTMLGQLIHVAGRAGDSSQVRLFWPELMHSWGFA